MTAASKHLTTIVLAALLAFAPLGAAAASCTAAAGSACCCEHTSSCPCLHPAEGDAPASTPATTSAPAPQPALAEAAPAVIDGPFVQEHAGERSQGHPAGAAADVYLLDCSFRC